jgi:hypothetical protein
MEASDKDGLSRRYGVVLWTAWTDPARAALVFYSERSRRAHLNHAKLTEQVAPAVLSYVKKPLRHNEVAESSGAFGPEANRSRAS